MSNILVTIIDANHAVNKYPIEAPLKPINIIDKEIIAKYKEDLEIYNTERSEFESKSVMYEIESFLRDDGVLHYMNKWIYCTPGSHHEGQLLEGNKISLLKSWKPIRK